ncbi:unnamed protein product [Dracunculus medinensis]|uniref:Chorein_N domain-containing protein n=1 Tax=Dracunculus medinensis TaxID=318479 RepID=A0A0N4U9Q3_DRAME|nr:unnamed protein product [Dracunculus medinensis]
MSRKLFARNITADQISVQILSGHGELRDIELNEEVLELPAWLRINRATCNRISVKVPWTRLQSSPLQMFVDEIRVNVQLTSETPSQNVSNFLSGLTDSSYGFANRVVEGMSLYVNSMEVHFDSGVFGGSFMLSRLSVESRSPGWQAITNLRYSRIIDKALNQMLMFKQVTWQLLRIEASVRSDSSKRSNINAPLRLITSSGKSRISIKKSILDGAVIGGRIQVILDDILWIATLPQVRSAIAFYSHIMSVIKAAPKKIGQNLQQNEIKSAILTTQKVARKTSISKTFQNFDFDQTSFHFYFGKIDLHLCDDNSDSSNFPQDWNIESGALQVTLQRISIDFYPANLAVSDRLNWVRYNAQNQCSVWVRELLEIHYRTLCSLLVANVRNRFMRIWPQLLSQNCIIRIYDLIVQCVTDSNTKKDKLFNVFMSDRNSKASVPPTEPLVHLEFTSFYHPAIEMPSNVTHLLLGPFSFVFDQRTIRWILYVCNDIDKTLRIRYPLIPYGFFEVKILQSSEVLLDIQNMPKTNFRIDALMPKVIVPLSSSSKADNRLPRRVVVSMSAVTAVNNENFQDSSFFKSLSSSTIDFIDSLKVPCDKSSFRNFVVHLNQNSTDGSENEERLWIKTSPIWVDTDHGEFTLSTPLLSDVAFHAVINKSATQIRIALQPQHFLRVTLDHFQYLQISHFFASFSVFIDQLEADINFFSSNSMAYIPISVICLVGNIGLFLIPLNYGLREVTTNNSE